MSAISVFWIHTASVETFLGAGPTGDTYAPPVPVTGFLDDGLVLAQSASGEQLTEKATFFGPLSFVHDGVRLVSAEVFLPESRVTVNGRAAQVSTRRVRDGGPLGLPDHIEVNLT